MEVALEESYGKENMEREVMGNMGFPLCPKPSSKQLGRSWTT